MSCGLFLGTLGTLLFAGSCSLAEAFDKLQELFDQFLGGKHPWSNTEGRKVDKRIH
jgi:hypothetical protein